MNNERGSMGARMNLARLLLQAIRSVTCGRSEVC